MYKRSLAEHDLTEYLMKSMMESTAEREIVRDVKEKLAYIALNVDIGMKQASDALSIPLD